jgi:hypothetical protein
MNLRVSSLLVAAVALIVPVAGFAQDNHETHHPDGSSPPPKPSGPGMMNSGAGMMSGHGAMMTDGDMPMMGMMMNHAEGYLSFLKTELKITDAQTPQWNAFADAERANAKAMRDMMAAMVANRGLGTFPERLELHEKLMTARLDGLRKAKSTADALYAVLGDDQKKTADELLSRSMGMM